MRHSIDAVRCFVAVAVAGVAVVVVANEKKNSGTMTCRCFRSSMWMVSVME